MIVLDDVYKRFGENMVLDGVSLRVGEGELLVIIGGSGQGKSVILKHILGFMKPDRGRVIVDGVDVSAAGKRELYEVRKNYGVLFQSAALLYSLSIGENLALPLREHTSLSPAEIAAVIAERLSWVDLEGVEGKMPPELSGGMLKRAGLARAIVRNPGIILFDEPTTGLDPVLSAKIGALIKSLRGRLRFSGVAVTHDMNLAYMIGDRIAMLYNGKIIEIGTPDEIRASTKPRVQEFIHGMPSLIG
ncbi:MAG TPA: ATP-binding cassette domain-containing protein [bacterium]|nr:ATP-binding cassette domain-containing protein [bacterium]HPQ65791.1 ATP-binding cassette domain-containing protein [bacterium]